MVIFKSAVSLVVFLMNLRSLDIFNPRILCFFFFYVICKNPVSSLAIFKFSAKGDSICHVLCALKIDGLIF